VTEIGHADVVIVGGGMAGAAMAHSLARLGIGRVVLLEQGRVASQGATSRSGGLLRLHHTARCDTDLAARSLPVFAQWGDAVGGDCGYRRTGFVMLVGEEHSERLRTNQAAATAATGATSMEILTLDELRLLYPGLSTDGIGAVAYEPEGGYADPAAATLTLAAAARRLGARIHEGVRVRKVLERHGAVTGVETSLGRVEAPLVVLAGGAWGAAPASHLGVEIPVVPRRIGLGQVAVTGVGIPGSASAVPTCIDDTTGSYFRPDGQDMLFFGVPSDPDMELGRDPQPLTSREVDAAVANVGRRIPAVTTAPLTGSRSGFDGYTPDKRPVIGPAGPEGLYLAFGFSGGGFKLAPAVAELAAEEITESGARIGRSPRELLEPYRPQRFLLGRPVVPEAPYDHM
jgi:glycine/D-amino acid oxidase-like deaminating enzyme